MDATYEMKCSTDASAGVVLRDLMKDERPGATITAPWAMSIVNFSFSTSEPKRLYAPALNQSGKMQLDTVNECGIWKTQFPKFVESVAHTLKHSGVCMMRAGY